MKNLSLGLNAILLIAVAILYVFHFSAGNTSTESDSDTVEATVSTPTSSPGTPSDLKLAFVQLDSLNAGYKLVAELEKKLERELQAGEAQIRAEYQKFEKDVISFRETASLLSQGLAEKQQAELAAEEQRILEKDQQLKQRIERSQREMRKEMFDNLNTILAEIKAQEGYTLIFAQQDIIPFLVTEPSMDITKQVLTELNALYEQETSATQPK